MKVSQSDYMHQVAGFQPHGVHGPGPGYDMKTLQRFAVYGTELTLDAVRLRITNARGEVGQVLVLRENLAMAVKRLLQLTADSVVRIEIER